MAGAEIGEPAARTVYQRRGVLPARAAEPFRHEKRHRVAGVLSPIPRRRALAIPRRQHPVGADFSCLHSPFDGVGNRAGADG